jgi:hypothetical protein
MASTETEIRELKREPEKNLTNLEEMLSRREASPELRRSAERLNRATVQRIIEDEAARCFPALQRATLAVQWGRQLRTMAEYAGDKEAAEALGKMLDQVAAEA